MGCSFDFLKSPLQDNENEGDPKFAVMYDGNGHTTGSPPPSEYFFRGDLVIVRDNTGNMAKPNHLFAGWNTSADGAGSSRLPGTSFVMRNQDVTLYAQWENTFQPIYVVINDTGQAWRSVDGSVWQGPYATGLTVSHDLSYGNGVFVAVGGTPSNYGFSWSADGISWTMVTIPNASSASIVRVQVSPAGLFMVAGNPAPGYPNIFTSTDGKIWNGPYSSVYGPVGPAWVQGSVHGNAFYLTTGNGVGWYKSTDGETWNNQGGTGSNMYGVLTLIGWNDRIIVGGGAPSNTNKQTRTSIDGGVSFASAVNVNTATGYVYDFAVNRSTNRVVSVGTGLPQVNYSDDYGASWLQATGISSTASFQRAYFDGQSFWVGNDDGEIYRSLNGASYQYSFAVSGKIRGIHSNHSF
ncbi:MAG: InlB B-repeat-containing protein [Spirochaetes bacterium]|nr:InlB B-repeat-containing protein [Spirochaetota bacterium]